MLNTNIDKSQNKAEIVVSGNISEVTADVACILQAVYEAFDEEDSALGKMFRMGVAFAITSGLAMTKKGSKKE